MLRSLRYSSSLSLIAHRSTNKAISTSSFSSTSSIQSGPLTEVVPYPYFFSKVALPGKPDEFSRIPAFRVLDGEGKVLEGVVGEWREALDAIGAEKLVRLYKKMLLLPSMVSLLFRSTRDESKLNSVNGWLMVLNQGCDTLFIPTTRKD
jgi:hypothetical protein